ncbi:arsenate reductase (glutaredoxin) [Rhizobiales bacterium]|uniref:arsenate reductase (glutaredoxin) n=1 Tax=Hongsoonwoonella zoysiae TaxID=2821844 RepID=UPI00156046F0|nr:arsenate reductase (glutaredoxin) [Hongsoonwoonella zoysiae]NRG19632.1 arsenate reductase (glutaredoxin) [Hongsoonwoonella zoysiae]
MTVTIWHNPRCSKSRETLALLEGKGVHPHVREYLKDTPNEADIRSALYALGFDDPRKLMRTGEALYKEMKLAEVTNPDILVAAMASNPILIERPVVFSGGKAMLGRPPEAVLEIL